MIESRSMNQCGRRDLNPHTHWVSDFKSEASADSATAALHRHYSTFDGAAQARNWKYRTIRAVFP